MDTPIQPGPPQTANSPWARNLLYLWQRRRVLVRIGAIALVFSTIVAFLLTKHYESATTLMPPEQQNSGTAMLAALAGRATGSGGLGAFAGGLLGGKSNGDLTIDLLRSGSVTGALVNRFQLQQVYKKRYMTDTVKRLAANTQISENKKSGVISIVVTDTDPQRAEDLARGYVEELNKLLARVSTSSARREREFIEHRLTSVTNDLNDAQEELSHFSSSTSTIDIKEQTHATVDAAAKLQAQLIVGESELESLKQTYGDENVRVRSARERVGVLQHELSKMSGSPPTPGDLQSEPAGELYPPLRHLPELGVRYANLYRRVKVQEAVYEMLEAQYETARIQEAKEIPTVNVIDAAGLPEKKSSPHRLYIMLDCTFFSLLFASLGMLFRRNWHALDEGDDLKLLARTIAARKEANA